MANQIRLSPEQLKERAQQYNNEAEKVNEVISRMDSLLQQLQSEWEGRASESFRESYAKLKPGFVKAENLIREIAEALQAVADGVDDYDERIAKKFRG